MSFAKTGLSVSLALVLTGMAHGQSVTLNAGTFTNVGGYEIGNLSGSGTLTFSTALIGATNAAGASLSQDSPALLTTAVNSRLAYTAASAQAPISSLTGVLSSGSSLVVNQVATLGGATVTTTADGFTNTGGFLSIDNLTVNLSTDEVWATLTGGNGLGTVNVALWNIGTVTGPTSVSLPLIGASGDITVNDTLSNLSFTTQGFNDFVQSLGLTSAGVSALQTVTSVGTITSAITLSAPPLLVPEPSTLALMGLGLLGGGAVAVRRRNR